MRTLNHRDKVDLFLTLLAGLPLLASGLFGLTYITSLMLSDYQHALWIAQAMSALLIWIGGYFCYYAWRKRRRILSDYDILYRHYPELADDWSRLSQEAQAGNAYLGLYCYKDHLVITAQGLYICPLKQIAAVGYQVQKVPVSRHLKQAHLLVYCRDLAGHKEMRDLGQRTGDRERALSDFLTNLKTLAPQVQDVSPKK